MSETTTTSSTSASSGPNAPARTSCTAKKPPSGASTSGPCGRNGSSPTPKKKRKKPAAFNPRTKEWLEEHGYLVAIVERWVGFGGKDPERPGRKGPGVRQDLFGVFDLIAVHPEKVGVLGIQVTDWTSVSKKRRKIAASTQARTWLEAKNRIVVVGWNKVDGRWLADSKKLTLEDLDPCPQT
jgi:hypothetical protein